MADAPFSLADRAELTAAAAAVSTSGAVVGSAGNLSLRRGDHILITPRRARLAAIEPADCVGVELGSGTIDIAHERESEPSSETPLHRAVYAALPDAGAVVHTHSHYATVLSTLVTELPPIHYIAASFGGAVRVAGYATFGSAELAANVAAALEDRNATLMANHGAIVTAPTIELAVEQALHLEWLASVYWHAMVYGTPAILEAEQLDAVSEQSRALRYSIGYSG